MEDRSVGSPRRQEMKSTPKLCLLFAALAFLAAPPDPAQGQAIQSTLLGTVTDATGAVVTGATVTVKNEGTNFERTMITDENRARFQDVHPEQDKFGLEPDQTSGRKS
ncbi:MAG: hypothetical protein DMG08_28480 [Acidobacteria bacterium]|nr:MAG: hypothetical protein DMG08_28480 [Acidobacteriota bacterium]